MTIPCTLSGSTVVYGTPARIDDFYNQWTTTGPIYMFPAGGGAFPTTITFFTQLDASNAVAAMNQAAKIARLKYVPTLGWQVAGFVNGNTQPLAATGAALDSTNGVLLGSAVIASNGVSPNPVASGSVNLLYASLFKLPN
jgi:hypothetical protein